MSRRRRGPGGLLAVAVFAVGTLVGCANGQVASPTLTPATPQPTFPSDDFTDLVLAAAGGTHPAGSDLDEIWAAVFDELDLPGETTYRPPSAVLGYRSGDVPDTACARNATAGQWRNNAGYCPSDQRIVYDEDWLRKMASEDWFGDSGHDVALAVLAHEWGHHVQWLLGRNVEDLREELQADCLSGMYLAASNLTPHESSEDEVAFLGAAMTTWYSLGNETYDPKSWFGAQEHGSPVQRTMATSTGLLSYQRVDSRAGGGMEKGLPFCFGYLDYEISDVAEIGPYRFLELPGRASTTTSGIYLMEPETRTGQDGSHILMAWIDELPLPGGATEGQLKEIWKDPSWAGIDVGEALPISASIHAGTGIDAPYQYVAADGSNPQTGKFGLVSPGDSKGGLLVLTFQRRLAENQAEALRIFEEAIITMNQVMSRLCTPDESPDTGAASLDPACMAVQ